MVHDPSLVAYLPFRSLPAAKSFPSYAIKRPAPSASVFRLPSLIMNQDEDAAENASGLASQHKAALSFILSSDGSLNEPTVAKRRRSVASTSVSPTASAAAKPAAKKGSKFCTVEGCTSRAKHAKRCWKHGGWVRCKVSDCNNRAKSRGVCWSHGGGTACSFEGCDTIAVSNGFCWAHGGGKRCQVPNCSKPAFERTQNYCQTHYDELGAETTTS